MADPRTPFLGVPQGDIRAEIPDGISTLRGDGRVRNTAWDGDKPWPLLVPGNFDLVSETGEKK